MSLLVGVQVLVVVEVVEVVAEGLHPDLHRVHAGVAGQRGVANALAQAPGGGGGGGGAAVAQARAAPAEDAADAHHHHQVVADDVEAADDVHHHQVVGADAEEADGVHHHHSAAHHHHQVVELTDILFAVGFRKANVVG